MKKLGEWDCHHYPGDFTAVYVPSSSEMDPVYDRPLLYTVIIENDGLVSCDCPSFRIRTYCRHTTEVSRFINSRTSGTVS